MQQGVPRDFGGHNAYEFLFPGYYGMWERYVGDFRLPHIWRDIAVNSAKDLRRAVDYLIETRTDIDAQRLAFLGNSTGAQLGPIMTAVEPRFKVSVLLKGGLFSWERPPAAEPFNFLPRVKVPTLMINGRYDFYYPYQTSQLPMYERLGVPASDKRLRVFESGHAVPDRQEVMREVLAWLDRYLGPVTRR